MRDFHLAFERRWPDGGPVALAEHAAPDEPGACVIGTADGTMLTYPWATSPVFYIGKAGNLSERLATHRRWTKEARQNYWDWWWPRYQFGASFGADVAWFLAKPEEDPGALEAALVNDFYQRFGSIPVANRVWPQTPSGDDDLKA
ncbi:MAG: hypothetical protein OXQ29_19905 [Rhodospirillaceae bacterium]|nr:hypothetical protein [Rhodospirillaceae bacterium]